MDWLEEGYRCLRNAPARVLVLFYVGSVPFWIGFLFFWAEMSRGPLPRQIAVESALAVALLYIWMKVWQALYLHRLREAFLGTPAERIGWRRIARAIPSQALVHAVGLMIYFPALLLVFPSVAVSTFLQNASASAFRRQGLKETVTNAAREAVYEGRANYFAAALLTLFGVFVFGNFLFAVYLVPELARILLGWETQFTRGGWQGVNTTIFTALLAMTYLTLNPLWKSVCLLRCFHFESRATGEDLRVKTRRLRRTSLAAVVFAALAAGTVFFPASLAAAGPEAKSAEAARVDPEQLDREIQEVLDQRQYAWWVHEMRGGEEAGGAERGLLGAMAEAVMRWIASLFQWLGEVVDWLILKVLEWLLGREFDAETGVREPRDFTDYLRLTLFVLAVVLAAVVVVMAWKVWRNRRKPVRGDDAGGSAKDVPDLEEETIRPDSRTLDEWSRLAAELKEKGDLRLALRALYLASLSYLSSEGVLTAAVGKSNREYENELRRRAHDRPARVAAFSRNCRIYEQAWYGMYPVNDDIYSEFGRNLEELRRHVQVAGV